MPTYEYECTKCGEQFDYFQSIKEAPKETCEKCGGKLIKLLSAGTGLIFKGSGFYITDYKNNTSSTGNSNTSSKSSSEPSKSSDNTSSNESAPSSKADSAPSSTTGTKGDASK